MTVRNIRIDRTTVGKQLPKKKPDKKNIKVNKQSDNLRGIFGVWKENLCGNIVSKVFAIFNYIAKDLPKQELKEKLYENLTGNLKTQQKILDFVKLSCYKKFKKFSKNKCQSSIMTEG